MKNKKGDIFEVMLVVITLVVSTYAVVAFWKGTGAIEKLESPAAIKEMYSDAESLEYYLEDSAKLQVQQAYADILKEPFYGCDRRENDAVWDNNCLNNNLVKEQFIAEVKKIAFKTYPGEVEYLDNKLKFGYAPITLESKKENYEAKYAIKPEFLIEYPDLDLKKISDIVFIEKAECDKAYATDENKAEKIRACLSKMIFDDWNLNPLILDNFYKFSLLSKKYYFYDNSFKPVELKFMIRQ